MRARENSGFTLIEVMVTITVLAIMLAIAAPSFVNLIENSRVRTQADTLLTAINLARSEAVKQGAPMSIQNEPGGFINGWCVINGALGVANCDSAAVIKRFPALDEVNVSQGGAVGVTFDGRGYRAVPGIGANMEIKLKPLGCGSGEQRMREVSVSEAGRAAVTLTACN